MRLAAEVLEPRCLMTDIAGLDDASITAVADDTADPVTAEVSTDGPATIVVDASLWDDRGLTVLQDGDWIHVVHTGTDLDVIPPLPAAEPAQLILQGRDNAPRRADVAIRPVHARHSIRRRHRAGH